MEFHDFATTHDVARRLGLTDEPADRFYHQMQGVAIQAHRRGIPGTASEFNRYQSELNWCNAGRPYYKLWPAVIPLLVGVAVEIQGILTCKRPTFGFVDHLGSARRGFPANAGMILPYAKSCG